MANHMMNKNTLENPSTSCPLATEWNVDDILKDLAKSLEILRKLRLPNLSVLTLSGKAIGGGGFSATSVVSFPDDSTVAQGPIVAGPLRSRQQPVKSVNGRQENRVR